MRFWTVISVVFQFFWLWTLQASAELSGIPGVFANVGYGARPTALGGAYVGLADDVYSVLWNPAGITQLGPKQISLTYTDQLSLVPHYAAAFAQSLSERSGHSEAVVFSGDAVLSETSIVLGYAHTFADEGLLFVKRVRVGVAGRVRLVSFGNNADGGENRSRGSGAGFGLDAGIQIPLAERMIFGMVLRDFLNTVSYKNELTGSYREAVPTELILGIAIQPEEELLLLVDLDKSLFADTIDQIHLGLEKLLFKTLSVRGGMQQDIDGTANQVYSFGLGLNIAQFTADFSYTFHQIGNTTRTSIGMRF